MYNFRNIKVITLLAAGLLSVSALASHQFKPQPRRASIAESNKAPLWPTALALDSSQCQGSLSPQGFYDYIDKIEGLYSFMHQHLQQVDLNGDGSCEYIAFQTMDCGIGGCAQPNIKIHDQKVIFLGGQPEYWHFHSNSNGWLQLSTTSNAGAGISVQRLYEYQEGKYRQVRQDRYEQQEDTSFVYAGTSH